jgi:hypothetical protein
MGGTEGTWALVIGITVALFVPIVVWVMVVAGLIRIVRDRIRETCLDQSDPVQEAPQPMGHN